MNIRHTPLVAAVSIIAFALPNVSAQDPLLSELRIIQVSGTAENSLSADNVEISAEVRVKDQSLSTAQENSKASFDQLVLNLKEIGLSPSDISLEDHSLGKNYQTKDGERTQDGFYSEREFTITLKKADSLEAVYTELAQAEGISVRGTAFSRKDEIEIRSQVRTNALKAAREKAIAMADVYGQKIGKVRSIKEGSSTPFAMTRNVFSNSVRSMPDGESASGKVTVAASVEVVFELTN